MTYFYKRVVVVEVAGFRISEPKIAFQVERQADETTPNGEIEIYNLSKAQTQQIYDRRGPVRLDAGYRGRVATIFEGSAGKILHERSNLARVTKIPLTGSLAQVERLGGMTARSYEGVESVRRIVADIVLQDMGLQIPTGVLKQIPEAATVPNWAFFESSHAALSAIVKRVGMTWFEDDGVIRLNLPNMPQNDAETFTLSPDTGLIGAPTVTDEGAEAESFLIPLARVGGVINLDSDTLKGRWKISGIVHSGDNWTGKFVTKYDLRELT